MSGGGDETTTKWSLDLDVHSALENVEHLKEGLDKVGEVENLEALIGTLTHMGLVVGGVGAAIFAMKETVDLVFDAEKIQMVERQFEILSERAGLAGHALKEAMQEGAGGLLAEDELLQSANKGLVELGANAAKMGEIMAIAKNATKVMGGDLKNNFDAILQSIASGNTRALKHMGIIIDQDKAYKAYAASIGIAKEELSKAGQQHAILNAVLEQGKENFEGLDSKVQTATIGWAQFKATLKDVGDIAILAYEKIAGPAVRAEIGGLSAMAKDAKAWFQDHFGAGAEQAAVHTERLKDKIQQLKGDLVDLEQKKLGHVFDPAPGETDVKFQALTRQLKTYEAELGTVEKKEHETAERGLAATTHEETEKTKVSEVNVELRRKNQLKFEQQLDAMRIKNLETEKKTATSEMQVVRANIELKKQLTKQGADEQKKIDMQEGLSLRQKEQLKVEIAKKTAAEIKAINKDEEAAILQSLKNEAEANKNTAQGFADAWKVAGKEASNDLKNFAKDGTMAIGAVHSNMVDAFKAMGDGSKSASEAMKDALLGALGDICIAKGSVFLLAGIGELRPDEIAAGGALIALGSYLKSQTGGGGSSVPSASAGGGGGASAGAASAGAGGSGGGGGSSSPSNLQQAPQKTVNLTIAGNYYDSNETKTQLMTMIRQATDATDFNYSKVGGK